MQITVYKNHLLKFIPILLLPFLGACQDSVKVNPRNLEEISEFRSLDVNNRAAAFFTSGQFEQHGVGVIDARTDYFCFQKEINGNQDSLLLPKGHNANFHNIVLGPNGAYYFLDWEMGLFKLSKEGPIFIDDISTNETLAKQGLMISNMINCLRLAHFSNENEIIIPICRNYFNLIGPYKNFNAAVPMFCCYNIKNKKVRILHLMKPKGSIKRNFNGEQERYFSCVKGDTLLMAVPYTSEIVLYSIEKDKEIGRVSPKSTFELSEIQEFKPRGSKVKRGLQAERYIIESPLYDNLYYNQIRNEYYRIYYHGLPTKNANGEFTIWSDKKSSVLVLDENLNLKDEIVFNVEQGGFLFGITTTEKGFIMNAMGKEVNGKFLYYEAIL